MPFPDRGAEEGIGKATLAYRMARFVLAHPDPAAPAVQAAASLAVDAKDPVARRIMAQAQPDLLVIERTLNDKGVLHKQIAVDDIRRTVGFFHQPRHRASPAVSRKTRRSADIVDGDLLVQHALVVERPFDDQEIGLRLRHDPPRHRIFGIDRKQRRGLQQGAAGSGCASTKTRHDVGLPDALAPRSGKHAARGEDVCSAAAWPNRRGVARGCGAAPLRRHLRLRGAP